MQPKKISLFCLPCAGASATMYLRWKRLLPKWIDIIPLELPGRGTRSDETLIKNFNELTTELYRQVIYQLPKHYAFFGHSMGGLLCYGLAAKLQIEKKHLPQSLFVAACAAPSERNQQRFTQSRDRLYLINDLRQQGGTPPEFFEHQEMLDFTLNLLEADYNVCESFCYQKDLPLNAPIHVLGGDNDGIQPFQLEAWQKESSSHFSLQWFKGGHFFIREHENAVLNTITRCLEKNDSTPLYS